MIDFGRPGSLWKTDKKYVCNIPQDEKNNGQGDPSPKRNMVSFYS